MASLRFHLVHGTQFYLFSKPKVGWIQEGSRFRSGLREALEAQGHEVKFAKVEWSGRNRHGARLAAAELVRESVAQGPAEARHILVAHSHGGNACFLALKKPTPEFTAKLTGIACLSTPFLVIHRAAWALAGTVAWGTALFIGATGVAMWLVEGFAAYLALALLFAALVSFPLFTVLKHYRSRDWSQAPDRCDVPVLIVRCPGDEIASGIGLAAILARTAFLLERWAAWPLRLVQRSFLRFVALGTAILLGSILAYQTLPAFQAWVGAYWGWGLLVVLGPLFVGVPLRSALYGLAFGLDLIGVPLLCSMSAESTPLGNWQTWLVRASEAEKRPVAHSEIYELEEVHRLLASWASDLAQGQGRKPPVAPSQEQP